LSITEYHSDPVIVNNKISQWSSNRIDILDHSKPTRQI